MPFHAERLPVLKSNEAYGTFVFYEAFGYSILACKGSVKDSRQGTKTVFWWKVDNKEKSDIASAIKRIQSTPGAKDIYQAIKDKYFKE